MNSKRVGMAINYDYPDYGGILQAYASFQKVKNLGYEPETINIKVLSSDIKRRKIRYFAQNIFDSSIIKEKSQIVFKKIRQKVNRELGADLGKRYAAFDAFYQKKFKVSREYKSWDDLSLGCQDYDAVVVGSDQLWLPSNIAGDYYTLSFVPDNVKKISYATSFGVSKIAKGQEEKAKEYLSRIEYLSAREETGQKIIKEYTGRNVPLVCDPTLLLTSEEWDEEITPGRFIDEPYIFCYFMGNNPWQREFVNKIKEKTGYKIVALLHLDQYIKSDEDYVDLAPYDVPPEGFISLVKNAEIICTDSFHGTVFSLIYKKQFFTFKRFSDKATLSTNTRIDTLLKKLQVQDRLIQKSVTVSNAMDKSIDYDEVQHYLDEFRGSSLNYLKDSLGKRGSK